MGGISDPLQSIWAQIRNPWFILTLGPDTEDRIRFAEDNESEPRLRSRGHELPLGDSFR